MTKRHARLPTHPRTGLTALGFTSRGPVWPVLGGAPDAGEGGEGGDGAPPEAQPDGKPKTFTEDELERVLGERLARERAKYRDYDDLKQKAGEFDRLAEEQKSETQKLTERAQKAEREAAQARHELMRARVAAQKKRPEIAEFLVGETEDELVASADRLLAAVGGGKGGKAEGDEPPTTETGAPRPPDMDQGVRGREGKASVKTGWELYQQRHGDKKPVTT